MKEAVVETHFGILGLSNAHPVNGRLAYHPLGRRLADRARQILTVHLGQFPAFRISDVVNVLHDVATTQPHRPARSEAEVLPWSLHHEIIALDPEFASKGQLAQAGIPVPGVVLHFHLLLMTGLHVDQDQLERFQNRHPPGRGDIEHLPHLVLEPGHVGDPLELGDPDSLAEVADGFGWKPPPARSGKSGHARVVPGINLPLLHQLQQLALAHDSVVEGEARKLNLSGHGRHRAILNDPVIDRPVHFELQSAERMGDVLAGILKGMREVVHRIDTPLVSRVVMTFVQHTIDDGITHVHVG